MLYMNLNEILLNQSLFDKNFKIFYKIKFLMDKDKYYIHLERINMIKKLKINQIRETFSVKLFSVNNNRNYSYIETNMKIKHKK